MHNCFVIFFSVSQNSLFVFFLQVNKQQLVISQTSQALNLCNSTLEFMGSTEQVEAEKVLLLASELWFI